MAKNNFFFVEKVEDNFYNLFFEFEVLIKMSTLFSYILSKNEVLLFHQFFILYIKMDKK